MAAIYRRCVTPATRAGYRRWDDFHGERATVTTGSAGAPHGGRGRIRRPIALAVLAGATAAAACGSSAPLPATAAFLTPGTWGGENAGMLLDDTVAHVHVGCTLGDFPAPVRLDGSGRFTVAGRYVLRAYPVAVGPSLPARFAGTVTGGGSTLTLRVTVDDTVARSTVELGPVVVTLGREPRMGPCPICRTPRAIGATPGATRR